MRVLRLEREPSDQRTGVFTSGIVAIDAGRKIALYFTGRQHAGENLAEVLKQRAPELGAPIQMCDAASRNVPKLSEGVEILVANCLAHGRRQFVEVAQSFPRECRHVLEALGRVYYHDAQARSQNLSAQDRLRFHQQHSAPGNGRTARLDASAAGAKEDRTQLNPGQGYQLYAAALERTDGISTPARRPD
jgi:transposase